MLEQEQSETDFRPSYTMVSAADTYRMYPPIHAEEQLIERQRDAMLQIYEKMVSAKGPKKGQKYVLQNMPLTCLLPLVAQKTIAPNQVLFVIVILIGMHACKSWLFSSMHAVGSQELCLAFARHRCMPSCLEYTRASVLMVRGGVIFR